MGIAALLSATAFASPPPASRARSDASPDVSAPAASAGALDPANAQSLLQWLQRIREAATHVNYIGTLVNWAGATVTSSRVAHFNDVHGELERIDALDGETRGILRVGDQVRTIWPAQHLAVMEPQDPRASFPSLVTGGEQRIPEWYEVQVLGTQRIAGRTADHLLLKARDGLRFDEMIWADRATGLLLRLDVQAGGKTLESSAFSEVSVGVRPQPELVFAELHRSEAWHLVRTSFQRTRLEAEGWQLKGALPPGFQVFGCVRRTMPGIGPSGTDGRVMQAIFTDGLTHVSVFVEPFQRQRHTTTGLAVTGATHTMMRRSGDDWLTAVGDVPPATLEQFLQILERRH